MHSRLVRGGLPAGSGLLLVPAAALVVHQLRYSLTYGSRASSELAAQGHSYLHSLVPWAVLALGIGLSAFLRRAARASRAGDPGPLSRLPASALWGVTTAGLVSVYALQELLEEFFAYGHPGGVAGVFGHGGWRAVPVAAAVALGIVALLRLGRAVLRLAGRLAPRRTNHRPLSARRPVGVVLAAVSPLAGAAAGRAPPLA